MPLDLVRKTKNFIKVFDTNVTGHLIQSFYNNCHKSKSEAYYEKQNIRNLEISNVYISDWNK